MNTSSPIYFSLLAISLAILCGLPASAQKHIIAAADKIRSNDNAGASIENVVKRNDRTRKVESKILCVQALDPKLARSMAHAVELDENDAYENRKNVQGGFCTQVLRFNDGKCETSVVLNYRVKDFKDASVVVRENFFDGKSRPRRRTMSFSAEGYEFDPSVLESLGSCGELRSLESLKSLEKLRSLGDIEVPDYTIIIDSDGKVIFRQ